MIVLFFSYNRLEKTKESLPVLAAQCRQVGADLVIWDNASRDGSVAWLWDAVRAFACPCRLIESSDNLGKARATNTILERFGFEHSHFVSVDDDAVLHAGCLPTLCAFADASGEACGMVSPLFARPDTGMPSTRYVVRSVEDFRLRIGPAVSGACFASSVPYFLGLGGYPVDDLPVYGREDGWLCGEAAGRTERARMDLSRPVFGGYLEGCVFDHRPNVGDAYAEYKRRMTFDPAWRTKQNGYFDL